MAKQLQALLANFDDSGVFGLDLISQILNPFLCTSLISLSQVLFTSGHLSNAAVLDVFLEHLEFLHVFFKALARILRQLGLTATGSPGERCRVTETKLFAHSFLTNELWIFVIFIIALLQLCFAFAMLTFGFVFLGHFEAATEVGA